MNELIEEIKAILTEGEFTSRWSLIEMNHEIGKLLVEQKRDITEIVHGVAVGLNRSERSLWTAVRFYKQYPNLNLLPEGKNVSMNQIVNKYLTTPKEKEEHEHKWITICATCKERKLDNETNA
jgi:hypothetical protein